MLSIEGRAVFIVNFETYYKESHNIVMANFVFTILSMRRM